MQRLNAMTLGALCIGFAGFIYDSATAQTPARACPAHAVSIYFEKDAAEVSPASKQLVERIAQEAKACGAKQVTAELRSDNGRAAALSGAFATHGVKLTVAAPPRLMPVSDGIAERTATVRIFATPQRVG